MRPLEGLIALGNQYYLFGGAALISLIAFLALILGPAMGAFGRGWEKATAAVLSLFVLVTLVGLGLGGGLLVIYYWPDISGWF
ncbi:hypothetical protein BH10ACT11_BH10ACT11_06340 [soil metagenome]